MPKLLALLGISLLLILQACAPATQTVTREAARQQTQIVPGASHTELGLPSEGYASWYGPGFVGRRTANGEIFNPAELTAAHRTLPFGTRVRVINLDNGLSVTVRINDRGPFKPGRIIDLSRGAAERIRMVGAGTARVRIELLSVADSPVWAAAAFDQLERFDVLSRFHRRGDLIFLSSNSVPEPVLVRVIGNQIPAGMNSDLLLSRELYARLGARVYASP